jgi:hypothetical protein
MSSSKRGRDPTNHIDVEHHSKKHCATMTATATNNNDEIAHQFQMLTRSLNGNSNSGNLITRDAFNSCLLLSLSCTRYNLHEHPLDYVLTMPSILPKPRPSSSSSSSSASSSSIPSGAPLSSTLASQTTITHNVTSPVVAGETKETIVPPSVDGSSAMQLQSVVTRINKNDKNIQSEMISSSRLVALEFGVYSGSTLEIIRDSLHSSIPLYGFDSFEGLPCNWRPEFPAGTFAVHDTKRPTIKPNSGIELVVGWFDDVLPSWIHTTLAPFHAHADNKDHDDDKDDDNDDVKIALLHIDSDLYSSAITVLRHLNPYIRSGTVIVFDELLNYDGAIDHELRALYDWLMERSSSNRCAPTTVTSTRTMSGDHQLSTELEIIGMNGTPYDYETSRIERYDNQAVAFRVV